MTLFMESRKFSLVEMHPEKPISPYEITKPAAEHYMHYYKNGLWIELYIILCYANVYGHRQHPYGDAVVMAVFAAKILKREQPLISGNGKQTKDYVYVGDVVRSEILVI
ncbi:MAG TPA: NAD-dependent epimerase/dehydratase family protein [Nitrospirae bacterium]|nr:NAD-dependent epimerase/dehydratase family protein [Nitrospirota bacterium]